MASDEKRVDHLFDRRPFGSAEFAVPPIAIGCAPLGNMVDTFKYAVSEADAVATITAILRSPFPYIDTAALYGDGESERRIGIALRQAGGLPPGVVLQTKQGRDPNTNDYSGETVKGRMERSLKLLGVDRVDIVYLHDAEWISFESAMSKDGPIEALRRFRDEGVVRYLGVASGPTPLQIRYIETGIFEAVITHNRYTLLNQSADPLIARAHARGVAVLNAAPYGSGILAKGSTAYPRYAYTEATPEQLAVTRQIEDLCSRYGIPLAAVALQFSLRDPRLASTIVGMSRPERINQTIAYAAVRIPDAFWEEFGALPKVAEDPESLRWSRSEAATPAFLEI